MNKEELIRTLKEFQGKHPEELVGEEKRLFDAIMEIADDRDKYKLLYENEKSHTDTLMRIIKKIEEKIEEHLNAKSYGNHKYELFSREYFEELLVLLKEIR